MSDSWKNQLHYGDNLEVLREKVPDEVADLIYLDPPFNSQRTYNLLFKQVKGDPSPAQIMAFEDTWQWSPLLLEDFRENERNARIFDLIESLYKLLGDSEMMAYVLMMAPRLQELHRKLKLTGSFYLHCDPVASHYLKIVLDAIFGPQNFRNEITWKRTHAHGDAKRKFANISDSILFYSKTPGYKFNAQYLPYTQDYVDKYYTHKDAQGRRYQLVSLRSPNPRPNLTYDYKGYKPHANGWAVSLELMEQLDAQGRLHFPANQDGAIREKYFLDEMKGVVAGDVWTDIDPISAHAKERRGYPTQKPLALLERIIAAATSEGDVVLDPFAGCGTAVIGAQAMGRRWIGIDVTYLAISEIVYRLSSETDAHKDKDFELVGSPRDEMSAQKFFEQTKPKNHKPFEMWGVHLVEGEPQEKQGSDKGVDGRIPFRGLDKKLRWGLIQVKGGGSGAAHVRDFARVIDRDDALLGLFICFHVTKDMREEAEKLGYAANIGGSRKVPRLQILTIKELLEEKKQFDIPSGWRLPRTQGSRKGSSVGQSAFDMEDSED